MKKNRKNAFKTTDIFFIWFLPNLKRCNCHDFTFLVKFSLRLKEEIHESEYSCFFF